MYFHKKGKKKEHRKECIMCVCVSRKFLEITQVTQRKENKVFKKNKCKLKTLRQMAVLN